MERRRYPLTLRRLRANRRNAAKARRANIGLPKTRKQMEASLRNLRLAHKSAHKQQTWKKGLLAISRQRRNLKKYPKIQEILRRTAAANAILARAKLVRHRPSRIQRFLKSLLKKRGLNVKMEHSVPPYSLDLAFPKRQRAIEVDGPTHWNKEHPWYPRTSSIDKRRAKFLKRLGWKIFHVKANRKEVGRKFEEIVEFLQAA